MNTYLKLHFQQPAITNFFIAMCEHTLIRRANCYNQQSLSRFFSFILFFLMIASWQSFRLSVFWQGSNHILCLHRLRHHWDKHAGNLCISHFHRSLCNFPGSFVVELINPCLIVRSWSSQVVNLLINWLVSTKANTSRINPSLLNSKLFRTWENNPSISQFLAACETH